MPRGCKDRQSLVELVGPEEALKLFCFSRGSLKTYIDTPEDLEIFANKAERYFQDCFTSNIVPSIPGICNALGLAKNAYYNYAKNPYYADVIGQISQQLEAIYVNGLFAKESSQGSQFILSANFGYKPKSEVSGDRIVSLLLPSAEVDELSK